MYVTILWVEDNNGSLKGLEIKRVFTYGDSQNVHL